MAASSKPDASTAGEVNLITLAPGHFHASLFHKEMVPGVCERVHVYAPLGPDLLAHLSRVGQFNARQENPTRWQIEVHTGPDYWERLLAERPGNVVVLSGNNRSKIGRIEALAQRGLHVLADKPWIIEPSELPALQAALEAAEEKRVAIYDALTQRFEISCILQKEFVNDPNVFGARVAGSDAEPAVQMESVHYLLKEVAGMPSLRPAWFFDIHQQGEGLTDVGTHLVDLVQWTLFPEQAVDYRAEIVVLRGSRWPTILTHTQFQRVTGEREFPEFLKPWSSRSEEAASSKSEIRNPKSEIPQSFLAPAGAPEDRLEYFANNSVLYTVRGIYTKLIIRWEFEAPPGAKDSERAVFRGSKSRIEVRQGQEEEFRPEIFVVPSSLDQKAAVLDALQRKVQTLQKAWPGLAVQDQGARLRVIIPERYRIGHEAHFSLLTRQFLDYVRNPKAIPFWEKPNMLAKYFVTTKGIELARQNSPGEGSPKPAK